MASLSPDILGIFNLILTTLYDNSNSALFFCGHAGLQWRQIF